MQQGYCNNNNNMKGEKNNKKRSKEEEEIEGVKREKGDKLNYFTVKWLWW